MPHMKRINLLKVTKYRPKTKDDDFINKKLMQRRRLHEQETNATSIINIHCSCLLCTSLSKPPRRHWSVIENVLERQKA